MASKNKCTSKKWCKIMDEKLAPEANSESSGFTVVVVTNFKTLKRRTVGVAFKDRRFDKGIFVNFCPWCGADIQPTE